MDDTQFWDLIAESRRGEPSCEDQAERLSVLLSALPAQEIVDYGRHFDRHRSEAYRWDLWAVATIINGGCSDDGFEYFTCWLIGRGKEAFEAAMVSPNSVGNLVSNTESTVECEDLLYAASVAYERITGKEMPFVEVDYPEEPAGERWEDEDLPRLYPSLCERFWGED